MRRMGTRNLAPHGYEKKLMVICEKHIYNGGNLFNAAHGYYKLSGSGALLDAE